MNIRMKTMAALAVSVLFATQAWAQQIAPFKAGDRVTFVGNSITDGGHYHSYIWLYYMTRFPGEKMWMANCGVGGDTSLDILNRLDDDVLSKKPTVLTLTFGMNDSGYFEYNGDQAEAFGNGKVGEARRHFLDIEKRLKALRGVRVVMIGTSPYDQTSKFNNNVFRCKNDYMRRMIAFQDSAARANRWEFLDFNAPMLQVNAEQQAKDSTFTVCGNDRVHPDNDGHMLMAYLFLKAQGMAGRKVADIDVDAKACKVKVSDNCTIGRVSNSGGTVAFDYLARSLPYPLDTIAHGWGFKRPQAQVTRMVPAFMQEMDSERLKVTGLAGGSYRLTIDSSVIGSFTSAQLAEGVNLAEYRNTPQYEQAMTIMALNEDRWEIERRFRDYAWLQYDFFMKKGYLNANNEEAAEVFRQGQLKDGWVAARRELYDKMIHKEVRDMYTREMQMIVDRIYEINKPLTRRITLTPQP
jgi:lysophospholipase L1-like esterase